MADEPVTPDPEQAPEQEEARPEDNLRGELERRTQKQRQAEKRAQELEERLLQFEDRDKTELERERDARVRLEQRLTSLEQEKTALQKGSWIRSAASAANFHDPEDAFSLLRDQLAGFEDERDAERAVKRIANQKKHLVKPDEQPQRPSVSALFSGQAVQDGQNRKRQLSPQEQAEIRQHAEVEQLAQALGEVTANSPWRTIGS